MNPLLLSVALAVGAPALKEKPKAETDIVGMWAVESMSFGGKAGPPKGGGGVQLKYEFTADGKWVLHREAKGGLVKAPADKDYKVDVKGGQKTIDALTPGSDRPAMQGIYKVDGDTLTICWAPAGGDRPTEFATPDGARVVLMVLKRVKKE